MTASTPSKTRAYCSTAATWITRAAVASVWFYQGLWNKLLSPVGRHAEIVASVPSVLGISPGALLMTIGAIEVAIAVWVLVGAAPIAAAGVQTALLVAMNVGGLLWARDSIADPGAMVTQNFAFLALVWVVACRDAAWLKQHV